MIDTIIPEYNPLKEKAKRPREVTQEVSGIQVGDAIIDPELLYKLAQSGANNMELADFFGTSESQIRYYFTNYLQKARSSLKIKLRRAQLKVAIENENPTMLIWLGKNILGQSDSQAEVAAEQVLPWLTETVEDATQTNTTSDTE